MGVASRYIGAIHESTATKTVLTLCANVDYNGPKIALAAKTQVAIPPPDIR